jgi:hypothetical protein
MLRSKMNFTKKFVGWSLTLLFALNCTALPIANAQTDFFRNLEFPFFDPGSEDNNSFFCLGGSGGSGPLYGPAFPQIPDTAALSAAIKDYISNRMPDSPLTSYSDAFVGLGLKYNTNPALVVAMAQKETSLGTAGYGTPSGGYNITNIRPGGSFARYGNYTEGISATYQNLRSGLYLDPPSSFTTIAQVINRWAPPSDNNDTNGYIQFVGDIMKKILGSLPNLPPDSTADSCSSGGGGSGPVDGGTNAVLAQKILSYQSTGKYHCDNSGDCADLQKIVNGQSLAGSDGCQAQTLDPRVLKLILYLIEVGNFKVGTYALCGDHGFDGLSGHSGGLAVDISSVNGASLGLPLPQSGTEGTKMDHFLNNLPAEISLGQQITYGYGGHYYAPMAATQQYNGSLCNSSCVSIYTLLVEQAHTNHIHAGFKAGG